ncbi:MAG: hypothetical protein E7376_00375 [Clostridiales bacterium]|nr:hypothetical protein [Clostridiales bacterium]
MINYNKESRLLNLKYACLEFYNKNKILIIILGLFLIVALLTGIFTSIKLYNLDNDIELEKFSMYSIIDGSIYTFRHCLLRMLSSVVMVGLLFIFSLNGFLSLFGYMLLIYRAFLITLNCTFVIISIGLGGIIGCLIIILPCQLLSLMLQCVIFMIFLNVKKEKKRCGFIDNSHFKKILIFSIVLLIANLLEGGLLIIFKPTTILIM